MAKIASLSVSLEADISKFEKNMVKSSKILSAFNQSAAGLAGKGIDLIVASATAAAVGLGYLVGSTINSITANTRLADRLQISTEAMAGFALAAKSVGVDSETANSALTHLSRKLGEAQAGGEEAQKAFQELGIDLVKISSQSGAQQLRTVADAIKGIGSASGQSAALVSLFGKTGAELSGVFSQGGEALDNYQNKAVELGLAINRIDSAKVVQAHESFENLKSTFDGLITKLTVELSPYIAYVTNQFTKWATSSTGGVHFIADAMEWLEDKIGAIVNSLHLFKAVWAALQSGVLTGISLQIQAYNVFLKAIETTYNKIAEISHLPELHLSEEVKSFADSLAKDGKASAQTALKEWDALGKGEGFTRVHKAFEEIRMDATQAAIQVSKAIDAKAAAGRKDATAQAETNQFAAERKEHEKWVKEMEKKAEQLSKNVSPFDKFKAEILEAAELYKNKFIDSNIFGLAQNKATDEYLKAIEPKKSNNSFKEVNFAFMSQSSLRNQDKKTQEVHSKQLDQVNKTLEKIDKSLGYRQMGVS